MAKRTRYAEFLNRHGNPLSGLPCGEAMSLWQAARTPEEKEATRLKQVDAAVCRLWIPTGKRNNHGRKVGSRNSARHLVDPKIGGTTLAKIEKASIKRIIKDLVGLRPELIENAIIDGLMATPPRSFPYVALAAAYLDGKPVDAERASPTTIDLSNLSRQELMQRALTIAAGLQRDTETREREVLETEIRTADLAIIDVEVIAQREPTLEELQADIVQARAELRRAEDEVRVTQAVIHSLEPRTLESGDSK